GTINNERNNNQLITNLLVVDTSLRGNAYQNEIETIATRIVNPQNNKFLNVVGSYAKGISNQLTKGVSGNALKIFTAGKCLVDLTTFLTRFS
ncbi:unnamed protein product, partial [Didymodactylos carnosus]